MRLFKNEVEGVERIEIVAEGSEVVVRAARADAPLEERERIACGDADEAAARVETRADELVDQGAQIARQPEPHAAKFYRESFVDTLVEHYKVVRGAPSTSELDLTEAVYGQPAPPELRMLLELRSSAELGWCNFGEWRIWPEDLIPFIDDGSNLFEQLLGRFASYSLRLVLTDLVPLGTAGNGDGYHVFLDVLQPECPPVFFYDHETDELSAFCDSISTLAQLNRLYEINAGDLPHEGELLPVLHAGMSRIADRVAPSWHYRGLVENSETKPAFELKGCPAELFWFRSRWIAELMQGDVKSAGKWFQPLVKWHERNMNWESSKTYWSFLLPSRGLYWLYTLYFFERPELAEACALAQRSPSRLLRDAATVFGELANGRTHVGKLDFAETRRRFAALGLDPAQAEQRRREQEAAAAARRGERQAQRERARAWAQGRSLDEIASEIWRSIDMPPAVRELADLAAAQSSAAATALARASMVAKRETGWDQALEALTIATTGIERAMLVRALVDAGLYATDAVLAAMTADERARVREHGPELVSRVRTWTRAKYGKEHAVRALVALDALDGAALEGLFDRYRWIDDHDDADDEDEAEEEAEADVDAGLGPVQALEASPSVEADDEDDAEDDDDEADAEADDEAEAEAEADDEAEAEADDDDDDDDDEAEADADADDDDDADADAEDEAESSEAESSDDDDDDSDDEAPADDPDEEPDEPELDDETPLVETPAYLRSITDKDPLRAVIETLGRRPSPGTRERLLAIVERGPADVRIPAIHALARLPGDDARASVEALLDGPHRRAALYGLACRRDPASLAAVERSLASRRGLPDVLAYEHVMLAAVRDAAGQPIDLDAITFALRTELDNAFADVEMHEIALDLLARHAPRELAIATLEGFLDAETARIRTVARELLRGLGQDVRIRVLDAVSIAALHASEGLPGLRAALADPYAIHRDAILHWAHDQGVLPELEHEAIALVAHMARFEHYTCAYARKVHERTKSAIEVLFHLATPTVDAFLLELLRSPSAALRKAFEYEDDVLERLRPRGSTDARSRLDAIAGRDLAAGIEVTPVVVPRFVLGEPVHAIAFADDAVIVGGGGRVTAFTRDGRAHASAEVWTDGWCYDIVVHDAAIAIGYSHGHCIVHDRRSFARRGDLGHGGAGVRKVAISPSGRWLATACDDQTLRLWDLQSLASVRVHREPFDVNSVAWIDEDTLAFVTDRHLGVVGRERDDVRRIETGGGAEVQFVDGMLLVGTATHGLVFVDPATLAIRERLPVHSVARARLSADGRVVFVACWDGEYAGLSRWSRDDGSGERVHDEALFGMEIDPVDRRVLCGGRSNRVTVADASGRIESATTAPRDDERATNWLVLPPGSDSVVTIAALSAEQIEVLDAGGAVVRHDLAQGRGRVLVRPGKPLPRAAEAHAVLERGVAIAAFAELQVHGIDTPWSRTTDRCEKSVAMHGELVAGSGKCLAWLDPATGELLAQRDAGVESSWIEHILAVDDDRMFVAGYDDGRLQLWSSSRRSRVAETRVEHRHDDGRFARPYGITVDRRHQRLAVSYWDQTIDVFALDGAGFELLHTLAIHDEFEFLAFDHAGTTIVGGDAHQVVAHRVSDGQVLWRWPSPRKLTALAVLEDGRVVVGSNDGALAVLRVPRQ